MKTRQKTEKVTVVVRRKKKGHQGDGDSDFEEVEEEKAMPKLDAGGNPEMETVEMFTPCDPDLVGSDPQCVRMKLTDMPDGDKLLPPMAGITEFLEASDATKPSVCDKDIKDQMDWTQQFGIEG